MNSTSKQRKTRFVLASVYALWLFVPIFAQAEEPKAPDKPLVPQKDAEVNKLLVQIISATTLKQAQAARKLLSEMPADRRQSGLAYALIFRETRMPALEYFTKAPPEAPLMPFVLNASKWETAGLQLLTIRILRNNPDKGAIPIILEYVLENSYSEWSEDEGYEGTVRIELRGDLYAEAAFFLNNLTGGAIGIPEEDASGKRRNLKTLFYSLTEQRRKFLLAEWRGWWGKNSAKILPDWKPDEIGKNEDEMKKWCEQRAAFYGKEATQEFEKVLEQHIAEKDDSKKYEPDGDIFNFDCPRGLDEPPSTPVLIRKILETASQIPAGEPAPEKKEDVAKALRSHRIALLALTGSKDRRPVSQFLLWALKNDKIKDLQAAACALGRMGDQEAAVEALKFILEQKITPRTLREVTVSLGLTRSLRAIEPLAKILEKEDAPKVAFSVIEDSLLKIGTETISGPNEIVGAFAPYLTSRNVYLANFSLSIMSRIGNKEAAQAIRDALPNLAKELKPKAEKILQRLSEEEKEAGKTTPPSECETPPPDEGTAPPAENSGKP